MTVKLRKQKGKNMLTKDKIEKMAYEEYAETQTVNPKVRIKREDFVLGFITGVIAGHHQVIDEILKENENDREK